MNQAEIVKLLRDARYEVDLASFLPAPFKLTVGAHDTGCQPYIWARAEGVPQVLVWVGSIWYSSQYEFNDRDKILGYQPGCEWAAPVIDKFFSDVAEAYATVKANRALAEVQRQFSYQRRYAEAVDYYKSLVGRSTEGNQS
jgi:hypothetical protein